jgi:hypothetical protein
MNFFVSTAAIAAVPTTAPALASDQSEEQRRANATVQRAEEVVDLLRTRYVRKGWKIDERAAERALAYFRKYAADGSDDSDEMLAANEFLASHGQSLDWVYDGKHFGMICSLAHHSKRAIALTVGQCLRDQEKPTLADLIDNLAVTKDAAESACTALSECEEKYRDADGNLARLKTPKVYGGPTNRLTISVEGREPFTSSGEWFFESRKHVKEEGTPEQLADWDRQARAARRAFPKELRAAEREQTRALDIWTAAERALTTYKPTSAAEAVELLTLAGKPQARGELYLDIDEWAFHRLVANCAAALREAFAN